MQKDAGIGGIRCLEHANQGFGQELGNSGHGLGGWSGSRLGWRNEPNLRDRWLGFYELRGGCGDGLGGGLGIAGGLEVVQLVEGAFDGALGGVDAALEAFEGTLAALEAVAEGGIQIGRASCRERV